MESRTEAGVPTAVIIVLGVAFLAALWGLHLLNLPGAARLVRDAPWATPLAALGAILLGISLVRGVMSIAAARSVPYLGMARVQGGRLIVGTILYITVALAVASQTQIDLSGIALSGAVTGVIVGIAAQASIANVIAGLVILFVRPFRPGHYVTVRAAAFAGSEYSGEVGEVTLFYTTLLLSAQEIRVPNSAMVTSVVTLRPQVLDVYVPVLVPAARGEAMSTTELATRLMAALPPGRQVRAAVEKIEGETIQIGVRASLADEAERSTLEAALIKVFSPHTAAEPTGPHPLGE